MIRFLIRRLSGRDPALARCGGPVIYLHAARAGWSGRAVCPQRADDADATRRYPPQHGAGSPGARATLVWINNLLHGNLGMSYTQYRPVSDVICDVVPNTVPAHGHGHAHLARCRPGLRHPGRPQPRRLLRQRHVVRQLFRTGDAGLLVRLDAATPLRRQSRLAAVGGHAIAPKAADSGTCCGIWPCRHSRSPSAASPAGAAMSAPRPSRR